MCNVNYLAVLVSAITFFILGGIWYSPKVFGHMWGMAAHIKEKKEGHPKSVYVISFILALISAWVFGCLLGTDGTLEKSMQLSALIGFGCVGTQFGINYLFAGRTWKMLLIDAGYHGVQFLLYGLVFGLWPR